MGRMQGRKEAAARGWKREPRLAEPLLPDGPGTRPPAAGRGVRPREAAHLSDPPFDDGFGREDPLAHCRQLHLAQRHPQPIILPAPAAGAAPLAHAPQRTGPGGRARGGARARAPAAGRHVTLQAPAVARTSPSPGAVARENERTRGGGARWLLKEPCLVAGAGARIGSWLVRSRVRRSAGLRFPLPSSFSWRPTADNF